MGAETGGALRHGSSSSSGHGIEAGDVVFIDAKGHDAGFGLPRLDWVAWFGRHLGVSGLPLTLAGWLTRRSNWHAPYNRDL